MAQKDHDQNPRGREQSQWQGKANKLPGNKFYWPFGIGQRTP